MAWLNRKSVASTVVAASILAVGAYFWDDYWDHRAEAEESHQLGDQPAATQAQMAEVVMQLATRAAVGDARARAHLELCDAGKLDDEALCQAARSAVELLEAPPADLELEDSN